MMKVKDSQAKFAWSLDNRTYKSCGDAFKMREGKWIGAKFGYVSVDPNPNANRGWIDADWIRISK